MALPPANEKESQCIEHLRNEIKRDRLDAEDKDYLLDENNNNNTDNNNNFNSNYNQSIYLSFARAKKGDKKNATTMMNTAIDWRRTTKPFLITSDVLNNNTDKDKVHNIIMGGLCKEGRPSIWIRVGIFTTYTLNERVNQLTYYLETLRRKGYLAMTVVVDFEELKNKSKNENHTEKEIKESKEIGKKAQKECEHILSSYYPSSMTTRILFRPPWFINMVPGYTKSSSIEALNTYIDTTSIPVYAGGSEARGSVEILEALPPVSYTP